jgi:acyl-CoA synthetase (AMP-forming)/AMP-acid ligase II
MLGKTASHPDQLARRAASSMIGSLFEAASRLYAGRVAIEDGDLVRSYRTLDERVNQTAHALAALDPQGARRFAILSENRAEFIEAQLAVAKLGGVIACQNWRLTPSELQGTLDLIAPAVILTSPRHQAKLAAIAGAAAVMVFGAAWERRIAACDTMPPAVDASPEAPWLVLYTGGSTGLPKGAVISHRAEIARAMLVECDLGLRPGDDNLAWPAMFHMGGTEGALHALLTGGRVFIEDGFDAGRFVARIARHRFGWVSIMPGTTAAIIAEMERSGARPVGIGGCGVMPDLVPAAELARVTELLGAPWMNTFGSTETGTPPLSGGRIRIGDTAPDLGKQPSPLTEIRLVDPAGRCVARPQPIQRLLGQPGRNQDRVSRRLVPRRRPVPPARGRPLRLHRPRQRHDQVGRREHLSRRDRAGSARRSQC